MAAALYEVCEHEKVVVFISLLVLSRDFFSYTVYESTEQLRIHSGEDPPGRMDMLLGGSGI